MACGGISYDGPLNAPTVVEMGIEGARCECSHLLLSLYARISIHAGPKSGIIAHR
jgi:hypothetical protein